MEKDLQVKLPTVEEILTMNQKGMWEQIKRWHKRLTYEHGCWDCMVPHFN